MKTFSKPINSLEQMYIIIGFASSSSPPAPVFVIDYLMSFSSTAFSISSLQRIAPCWASPSSKRSAYLPKSKPKYHVTPAFNFPVFISISVRTCFIHHQQEEWSVTHPVIPITQHTVLRPAEAFEEESLINLINT